MQIHELKPKNKPKKKKRIGRGGSRGTFSGRGVKGQKARAGAKMQPMVRELLKRYPKLKGYKNSPLTSFCVINVSDLEKFFKDQSEVNPSSLTKVGLLKKSKRDPVKILGKGETKKKFFVKKCLVSESAKEKIEKAGGKVEKITKGKTQNKKEEEKTKAPQKKGKKTETTKEKQKKEKKGEDKTSKKK